VKAKTELKAARDNLLQIPMSRTLKSSMAPFLALLALSLMAGCAVGPNFKKPAAPDVGDYTGGGLSATVAGNNLPGGNRSALPREPTSAATGGRCFIRRRLMS